MPFDLGGQAEVAYRVTGLEAHFVVPARHIAGIAKIGGDSPQPKTQHTDAQPLAGRRVLLVEDSMIIALDAEDALRTSARRKSWSRPMWRAR